MKRKVVAAALMLAIANPALAGVVIPVPFQVGDETGRFDKGIQTATLERENGAVQITPLPMDHGSLAFTVVVFNDGENAANFGVENVSALAGGETVSAFTITELESKAKNRAMWTQIGIAVLAGAAAAAVSQAHTKNTYRSTLRTPSGTYAYRSVWRDNSIGVLGAGAATAGGVLAVKSIQDQLDFTLQNLGEDVIQTTTVDPGESYGGKIVLRKIAAKPTPSDVRINVSWNGEIYTFGLHVPKKGESSPTPIRAASRSRAPKVAIATQSVGAPMVQPVAASSNGPSIPNAQATGATGPSESR